MTHHLSLDVEPGPEPAVTIGDLCRRIVDTSGLPRTADIIFTLTHGQISRVGLEVAL